MSLNKKCPKCGSEKTQLLNIKSKHSLIKTLLFGFLYIWWILYKWIVAFMILIFYDWWMAIIKKNSGKGYVWVSKKWFDISKKYYYCTNCGHNFRG